MDVDRNDRKKPDRISFRAERDVSDALLAKADAEDRSLSYVLRRYVIEGLERDGLVKRPSRGRGRRRG